MFASSSWMGISPLSFMLVLTLEVFVADGIPTRARLIEGGTTPSPNDISPQPLQLFTRHRYKALGRVQSWKGAVHDDPRRFRTFTLLTIAVTSPLSTLLPSTAAPTPSSSRGKIGKMFTSITPTNTATPSYIDILKDNKVYREVQRSGTNEVNSVWSSTFLAFFGMELVLIGFFILFALFMFFALQIRPRDRGRGGAMKRQADNDEHLNGLHVFDHATRVHG